MVQLNFSAIYLQFDKLVAAASYAKLCRRFDSMHAVAGFDALYKVRLTRVVLGRIDKIDAGLVDRNRIE